MHQVDFVRSILARPQMYTLGGTYEEVIAFLEGYYSGVARNHPESEPLAQWNAFADSVSQALSVERSNLWKHLKDVCDSSDEALHFLQRHIEHYAINLTL